MAKIILTVLMVSICGIFMNAQEKDEFSPWDAWRKGYAHYEKAEKSKAQNNSKIALEEFLQARDCYLAVKKARPEWNQQIIDNRLKMCNREINTLRTSIDKHAAAEMALPPPLQSGKTTTSSEIISARTNTYELQIELDKYKKQFIANLKELETLRKESERYRNTQLEIANMVKEKAVLQHRLDHVQRKFDELEKKQDTPEKEKKELQGRLVEERMKLEIVNQRLKMQEAEVEKLNKQITDLLKSSDELKTKDAENEKQSTAMQRQISDANKLLQARIKQIAELDKKYAELEKERDLQNVKLKNQQDEVERLTKLANAGTETAPKQLAENRELAKKLTAAAVENEKLFKESVELKKREQELNESLKELREAIRALMDQRDQLTKQQKELAEQNKKITALGVIRDKEIAALSKKNDEISEELKSYIDKYDKVQKRLETRLNSEYQNVLALTKQVKEEQDKLKARDEELKKMRERYAQSQDNGKKLADTVQELKDKLTTLDDSSKQFQKVSSDYRKLQEEQKKLQDELQKLDETNRVNAAIAAKFQTASEQIKELNKSKSDLDVLKVKHQQALEIIEELKKTQVAATPASKKTSNIEEQLKKNIQQLAEAEKKIIDSSALLKDTRNQLQASNDQNKKLSEDLKAEKEKLAVADKKIAETTQALAGADKQKKAHMELQATATVQAAEIIKITNELATLKKTLAQKEEEYKTTSTKDLTDLRGQYTAEQEKNAKVLAELKRELAKVNDDHKELLRQKTLADNLLKQEVARNDKIIKDTAEREKTITDLRAQLSKGTKDEAVITQLRQELETNIKLIASLREQVAGLEKSRTAEQAVHKKLQEEIADYAKSKTAGELLAQKHQEEISELKKSNTTEKASSQKLRQELAAYQKTATEQQNEIVELKKSLEANRKKIAETSNYQAELQKLSEGEKEQIKKLQVTVTELDKKYTDEQERLKKLIVENERNKEVISQLRKMVTAQEKSTASSAPAGSDDLLRRQLASASEIHRIQLSERDNKISRLEQQLAADKTVRDRLGQDLEDIRKKLNLMEAARQSELAALENFNRSLSTDINKIGDSTPKMSSQEITWHATELLAVGGSAEKEEEWDIALWNYRKILEFDPQNFQANARIGSICMRKGMLNNAAEHFHTAMKKEPANSAVNLEYGLCLLEMKDYLSAEKLLAEAVKQHRNNDDLRSVWAAAMTYCGQTSQAEKELREILRRAPDRSDAMIYLAEALAENPNAREEASNLYRQARQKGHSPVAKLERLTGGANTADDARQFLYQSAAEAEKNNDILSAMWYYGEIRKLEGEQSGVANRLALMQLQNERPEEALANIRNRREDCTSQFIAGLACAMSEKYLDAAAFFRISRRLKQRNKDFTFDGALEKTARKIETKLETIAASAGNNQALAAARDALQDTLR